MRILPAFIVLAALGTLACPSDSGTNTDGGTDAGTDAGTYFLTIKNYVAWCSVTVNGNSSSDAVQTIPVAPGVIPVSAVALTNFELGAQPWHHTDHDVDGGDPGTRSGTGQSEAAATTVTVPNANKCIWVCCESAGVNDCPTTDQCP